MPLASGPPFLTAPTHLHPPPRPPPPSFSAENILRVEGVRTEPYFVHNGKPQWHQDIDSLGDGFGHVLQARPSAALLVAAALRAPHSSAQAWLTLILSRFLQNETDLIASIVGVRTEAAARCGYLTCLLINPSPPALRRCPSTIPPFSSRRAPSPGCGRGSRRETTPCAKRLSRRAATGRSVANVLEARELLTLTLSVTRFASAQVNVWALQEVARLGNFSVEFYGAPHQQDRHWAGTRAKYPADSLALLSISAQLCVSTTTPGLRRTKFCSCRQAIRGARNIL